MKIIILDGTHKKDGMTISLVNKFIEGIKTIEPNAKIKKYDLLNEKIQFCLGCGKCTEDKNPINAKCTIEDIMFKIKNETLDSDVVVFATPIYEYAVSSSMKRFLERCLTLVTFKFGPSARAKPIPGKIGVIILSSGAPFPFNHLMGITRYPKFILKLGCKLFRCSKIKYIAAGGMAFSPKIKKRWEMYSYKSGKNVATTLKKKSR